MLRTMRTLITPAVTVLASLSIAPLLASGPADPAGTSTAATAVAGPQAFTIDDVHSMAMFRVMHMGAGAFWGRFNDVSGDFTFEEGKAEGMKFDVTIKTESVDSGNDNLDKHLRSPDFFATKDFPAMTFKSTAARKTGDRSYDVDGELTMLGVTKPITVRMEFCGMADMGRGPKAGFEAQFTVKRSEFGMKYGVEKGAIGDEVRVVVGLEGGAAK
jgi:polyisoprenoid-binding protein YceI